jgi:hypothetical protein
MDSKYNNETVSNYVNALMTYFEGTVGSLLMWTFALVALVLFARWGWRKWNKRSGNLLGALLFLALAALVFILRSLVGTFFNDVGIRM